MKKAGEEVFDNVAGKGGLAGWFQRQLFRNKSKFPGLTSLGVAGARQARTGIRFTFPPG
jgi:hypothetical protein